MNELSVGEARQYALTAQGFGNGLPSGRVNRRHITRVIDRLAQIQLDSVNVLVRAHYMPLFSRLGPYPRESLDRLAYEDRHLFEYWGRMACLIPVELYPSLRWKMNRYAEEGSRLGADRAAYIEAVYDEVAARGPIAASELSDPGARQGPWWGWADGKRALEFLFSSGRLAALRRGNFERVYDIAERVIPPDVLARPEPTELEGRMELLRRAAQAIGIGTAADLRECWSLRDSKSREAISALVETGDLVPVRVEGWKQPAYLHRDATRKRTFTRPVLISPFDALVANRDRALRLFGFHYRIEIFVPAPKRTYGYYVLPFLLGDRFAARVDLKADRKASSLQVLGVWSEAGTDNATIRDTLVPELERMAHWLGLDRVSRLPKIRLA